MSTTREEIFIVDLYCSILASAVIPSKRYTATRDQSIQIYSKFMQIFAIVDTVPEILLHVRNIVLWFYTSKCRLVEAIKSSMKPYVL